MLRLPVALVLAIFLVLPKVGAAIERGVLWRVVQTCLANHGMTGASFPCLEVETSGGLAQGYAVLRAPFDASHTIVTPTVRTIGIEAERLRGADAPDYFQDAWAARKYAIEGLPREPGRNDLALAVNSRPGRSQDQLHIHVDCIRPDVKRSLLQQASSIRTQGWTRLTILPRAPRYWTLAVASEDLTGINVFDLAAKGLKIGPDDMDETTIVVVGADDVRGAPGFTILARQRIQHSTDEAHGEALLDHSCASFR